MNIIYDNIIYSLQKSGGISVYWKKLEDYISISKRILYRDCNKNIFYEKRDNEVFEKKAFLERYKDLKLRTEKKTFIFHSSYYRICKNKNAININTLHDFTYELYRTDLKSIVHKLQKKRAVMKSDGIICISNNTMNDLYKFYPKYKGKVRVIYHGYDSEVFKNLKQNRNNSVLFIGSRVNYKNFIFSVELLAKFPMLELDIIGGGDLTDNEKDLLERNIPNRYHKIGYVNDDQLSRMYNSAFALLYPSSYEGFGFPIIEAQACGCPVICQFLSSIPEVCGDCGIFICSENIEQSVLEISKLFDTNFYKRIQENGVENVKRFSWKTCITETLDFYKECLELRNSL